MRKHHPRLRGDYMCLGNFYMDDDKTKKYCKFTAGEIYYFNGNNFINNDGEVHHMSDVKLFDKFFMYMENVKFEEFALDD